MARIIAGRFDTQSQAERALEALRGAGVEPREYGSFYVMPPGQHDLQPLGGDTPHHSEGTKDAGKTAGAGAAIGGVTGLVAGTAAAAAGEPGFAAVAAVAGAAVGAYAGSLAGALAGSRQSDPEQATPEAPAERKAGVLVAVCTDREGLEDLAIQTLRAHGALEIERAEGQWAEGTWVDFDPRGTPQLVR